MDDSIATDSASPYFVALRSSSELTQKAAAFSTTIANRWEKMAVLKQYSICNDVTGNHIALRPDLSFCPVLIGQNERIVFLFQFIEILDELIDYENIQKLLPGFSFKQIGGAITFLRKLSQFNFNDIDIDAFIDSEDIADEELVSGLCSALPCREANIVLNIS